MEDVAAARGAETFLMPVSSTGGLLLAVVPAVAVPRIAVPFSPSPFVRKSSFAVATEMNVLFCVGDAGYAVIDAGPAGGKAAAVGDVMPVSDACPSPVTFPAPSSGRVRDANV